MVIKKGEQLWKLRRNWHNMRKYVTPDELWEAAYDYFEWSRKNPLKEQKVFQYEGKAVKTHVKKARVFTLKALCLHIRITYQSYQNYRKRDEFKEVCEVIDHVIETQKIEGAASGLFNAGFLGREMGLAEKIDNTHSGPKGGPIQNQHTVTQYVIKGVNENTPDDYDSGDDTSPTD